MSRIGIAVLASVALVGCGARAANDADGVRTAAPAAAAAVVQAAAPQIAAPQAAPAQPAPGAVLSLDPSTVGPGASFTATVTGCTVGETVTFTVDGRSTTATCEPTSPATTTTSSTSTTTSTTTTTTLPPTTSTTSSTSTTTSTTTTTEGDGGVEIVEGPGALGFGFVQQVPATDGVATASLVAPTRAGLYQVVAVGATSGFNVSAQLLVQVVSVPTDVPVGPLVPTR